MICPKYSDLRQRFAVPVATVSGAANNGSGLIRLTVSTTLAMNTSMPILVQGVLGTTEANGPWPPPVIIPATHIDLPGSTFTNAYSSSSGVVYSLDPDGFPAWPGPKVMAGSKAGSYDNAGTSGFLGAGLSLLRAGGFSSTWEARSAGNTLWTPGPIGPIGPLIAGPVPGGDPLFPLQITCNGFAADGSPGADAYIWYLSQRSDGLRYVLPDGSLSSSGQPQYFTLTHPTDRLHSGTVILSTQSAQIAALFPGSGGVPPTDAASLAVLFRDVSIYVSRISDGSFAWARFVAP